MKSLSIVLVLVVLAHISSCAGNNAKNPENWNNEELDNWFNKGEWKFGWTIKPDETINKKEFAIHFFNNYERWKKAFDFLKNEDLEKLKPGTYELDGKSLYAIVQEYVTKDEDDSRFEVHQQYIDLQYLVYGEEKIGVLPFESTKIDIPYDSLNDVTFLTSDTNNYRLTTPDKFFLFFPRDAHRPGVKTQENMKVRKIVLKILYDE